MNHCLILLLPFGIYAASAMRTFPIRRIARLEVFFASRFKARPQTYLLSQMSSLAPRIALIILFNFFITLLPLGSPVRLSSQVYLVWDCRSRWLPRRSIGQSKPGQLSLLLILSFSLSTLQLYISTNVSNLSTKIDTLINLFLSPVTQSVPTKLGNLPFAPFPFQHCSWPFCTLRKSKLFF